MKKTTVQKPVKPIHQKLLICWWLWLGFAIIGYPALIMLATGASLPSGVLVQVLAMLPALLFTPAMLRGNSPYVLICANLIMLIYLGVAGVLSLIRYYEAAPDLVWLGRLVEFVILLFINYYLFVLLKRLPPMHKSRQSP